MIEEVLSNMRESAQEAVDMDKQTRDKLKTNLKRTAVILRLFFIVLIILAIVLPGYIAYRPIDHCYRVEGDAHEIKGALAEYLTSPSHKDLDIKPEDLGNMDWVKNSWALNKCGDSILIHVVDNSGKCPAEYQERHAEWQSGIYTVRFLD